MQKQIRLGSLFDGSGGFPLAGALCGIEPVWASEIEPYPIRVTTKRFPRMRHLGDITKINGGKIEPVDVITFGSPCQDLSVAGKRAGIHDGARSSLFFHAVRIMKGMREATNGVYPRIIIWENVHGAYSSNKGEDFRAVLQALCEIAEPGVDIPRPAKGKWGGAGAIVGDGYSIAWRTYDAQYWGVPQRRRRIYLVADLGGERAGEILFERESLQGYPAQSLPQGQAAAAHAAGSAGGGGCAGGVGAFHLQQDPISGDVCPCIGGQHQASVGVFMGGQGDKAGSIAYSEETAPTLRAGDSGTNRTPDVVYAIEGHIVDRNTAQNGCGFAENRTHTLNATDRHAAIYPEVARTLTAEHDASPCLDRGQNITAYAADFNDSTGERAQGSMEYIEERSPTLRSGDVRAVVYDCRSNGGVTPNMTGDHENRVTDYTTVAVYPDKTGSLCANSHPGSYTGQDAFNDMLPVVTAKSPRRYIVRRLTPLECCRLQGFPDGWTENLAIENPTDEQIDFFTEVWARWAAINGTKPKSRAQVIKWLSDPQSDSAEYKAYGNSLAIPCAADVMGRVAKAMEEDAHD